MRITVIIPTLNSEKVISRVLEALYTGDRQPDEAIVVDGCSHDKTIEKTRQFPVTVYFNPKIHAAAARNIGIQYAQGEIIAFTDSDCVPQADWLARIETHFVRDNELSGVGGRMLPLPPTNEIEAFSGHVFLNEIMRFPDTGIEIVNRSLAGAFITANCAYQKETLLHIGGFRDEFGNNAEDIDLFWRLIGRERLYYDPEIVVYHSFPTTRLALARKYFQHGIASSKLTRYHLGSPRIDWLLYRKLVANLLRLLIPGSDQKWADLYCVQLSAHVLGKAYGSVLMRVINL